MDNESYGQEEPEKGTTKESGITFGIHRKRAQTNNNNHKTRSTNSKLITKIRHWATCHTKEHGAENVFATTHRISTRRDEQYEAIKEWPTNQLNLRTQQTNTQQHQTNTQLNPHRTHSEPKTSSQQLIGYPREETNNTRP